MNPANAAVRILLAEDNPGDVFLVREALSRHSVPHELVLAPDGQRAWGLIEAAEQGGIPRFDICLIDLNLPVRHGLELVRRIREASGPFSRTVIVIVSSSNTLPDRSSAAQAGADFYFCKPSDLEAYLELGAIVGRLWALHQRAPRVDQSATGG